MNKHLSSQRGAVALITTIIISLLLLVITTGLVSTMTSELRQQTDTEQSTTAYYAAESGVEDAVATVNNDILTHGIEGLSGISHGCSSFLSLGYQNSGIGWTCQLITYSGTPNGTIDPDKHVVVDPGNANYNNVTINWDTSVGKGASYFQPGNINAPNWQSNYAAPLEVTVIEYPKGAHAAGQGLAQKNLLLLPSTSGASSINFANISGNNPLAGACTTAASVTYHCSATINGLNGANNYMFLLRTRYVGTAYEMDFQNGLVLQSVSDGTATIDVTARSGHALRRVLYKISYKPGVMQGLDEVIYSDTSICKDFSVLSDGTPASGVPGC